MQSIRFFERTLWILAILLSLGLWLLAPRPLALGASVGGGLMALNFTGARWLLYRAFGARPVRYGYMFLYVLKFFVLMAALTYLVLKQRVELLGIAIGMLSFFAAACIFSGHQWLCQRRHLVS